MSAPLARRPRRSLRTAGISVAVVALIGFAGATIASSTASAQTTTPTTTAPARKPITLSLGTTKLGTIMVDGDGMSLYMFVPDSRNVSVCEGQCLTAWPAVMLRKGETLSDVVLDKNLRRSLLGVAMREDGSRHVTYNGFPLYWWFLDKAVGDTKGQWVGNVWFVLNDEGRPITPRNA